MRSVQRLLLIFVGIALGSVSREQHAASSWVTVAKDREREVQLDPATVMSAGPQTKVAWGRVVFEASEAARLGFASVRALNRFDCQNRTFVTVKRVYLDADDLPLREENVAEAQPTPIAKGSVDERLWRAVCQPASVKELAEAAHMASAKSAIEKGATTVPLGVDLADPNALPPEIAAQPVPNLLPALPRPAALAAPGPTPKPTPEASLPKAEPNLAPPKEARKAEAAEIAQTQEKPKRVANALTGPKPRTAKKRETLSKAKKASAHAAPDLCAKGQRQSPIALGPTITMDLAPPLWNLVPFRATLQRSPSGEQLRLESDRPLSLFWQGVTWAFEAASWHHPALHRFDSGLIGEWVLQFRHQRERLFVAIPVRSSLRTPPELLSAADRFPAPGSSVHLRWDWRSFLPVEQHFLIYEGSEPWPPCREGITWIVFREAVEADPARIAPLIGKSFGQRAPQPTHGRTVVEARR